MGDWRDALVHPEREEWQPEFQPPRADPTIAPQISGPETGK
jgi:hypothetical protein